MLLLSIIDILGAYRWLSLVVHIGRCVSAIPHILAKLYELLDAFETDGPEFTDDESATVRRARLEVTVWDLLGMLAAK